MTRTLSGIAAAVLLLGCRTDELSAPSPDRTGSILSPVAQGEAPAQPPAQGQATSQRVGTNPGGAGRGTPLKAQPGHELATFGAGCFWGVEDAFRKVPGVTATAVGYSGGHTADPTYEDVCAHGTGHAEVVLVEFDPTKVQYERLVSIFFQVHDPTTLNRQGPDVGDQYRSAIYTFSPKQDSVARAAMARAQAKIGQPVVTEIATMRAFYKAEDYHQQYAERTGSHGCPIKSFDDGI